jgi:Domain of unknown function (DUF4442)
MPFDHQLAKKLLSPWKLRLWMVSKLPMGLLSGMVIEALDEKGCRVMLKDRRWIRNPFGSVFWAVMGMAAELSTGALMYTFASGTGMKFILVGIEAKFFKKARGKSFYFCDAGPEVYQAFNESVNTNDTSIVILPVTAKDQQGEILAAFTFQWQLRKPIN